MNFDVLTVLGLFVVPFAATNVDNLALLVAWLLAGRDRSKRVLAGHLLGMSALLLLAIAFGLGAKFIPLEYVGYLGVIPIALGIKGLYALVAGRDSTNGVSSAASREATPISIAATQVANGVDTVLVFGPLLADSESGVDLFLLGGFILMTFAWFGLARFLERHAARLIVLERYGHWVAPIVLIVVGLYILDNTSTDLLLGD